MTMTFAVANEPSQQQQHQLLRLYLHSEISTSHSQHGVSHEDYDQYSAYCSRRLQRLRHAKLVKRELLHVRLYKSSLSTATAAVVEGGSGSKAKNAYRAIDLTNLPSKMLASHANFFLEPLYCAERCWATSMALKAEMNNNNNSNNSSLGVGSDGRLNPRKDWSAGKFRKQSLKRLKKAVRYANLVETLTMSTKAVPLLFPTRDEDGTKEAVDGTIKKEEEGQQQPPPVDEHTQMEARAYASFMRGNLALETNQWQMACTEYQMALTLCEALAQGLASTASAVNDDVDVQQLELLDFFTTRAKNVIVPLLKYCRYELQVCVFHLISLHLLLR